MNVNFKKSPLGTPLLSVVLGFAVSASAFATVTSAPTDTVKGRAPVMAAPTITHGDVNANSLVDAGDTLTAVDGVISDQDQDTPVASTYRWSDGAGDLDTAAVYTIDAADLGKRITLFAQPHTDPSVTDPADGLEVAGVIGSGGQIDVVGGNTLLSVALSGFVSGYPQVDTQLTATPTCLTTCGTVNYQWQLETAVGSNSYADISGANGNTYIPVGADQRRKIKVVASN